MLPWIPLGAARTPGGTEISLWQCGGDFVIRADGRELMTSRAHGSEEELAALGRPRTERPSVLVGGLGMGYTLRAALAQAPPSARVVCAELVPEVVAWNRGPLAHLAGRPLDDPRVRIEIGDVADVIAARPAAFDAILLDVDNGPQAMSYDRNASLYGVRGLGTIRRALRPGGALAIWCAGPPPPSFQPRFERAGFAVEVHRPHARGTKRGPRHSVLVGRRIEIDPRDDERVRRRR